MTALPVVCAEGLSKAQLEARACCSCSKRWPRPHRVTAVTVSGRVLMACGDCEPQFRVITVLDLEEGAR